MIGLRWEVANHSLEETEAFVKDVEKAVVCLLEEGNWQLPVGGFLDRSWLGDPVSARECTNSDFRGYEAPLALIDRLSFHTCCTIAIKRPPNLPPYPSVSFAPTICSEFEQRLRRYR